MGSFRSMAKDLMPPGMIPDEDDESVDVPDTPDSINSSAATNGGSDLPAHSPAGVGVNASASHSTVIIRSNSQIAEAVATATNGEGDVEAEDESPALDEDTSSAETASAEPVTPSSSFNEPEALGAPPAYVRTPRRASYAARNNANGTLVRDIDLGTGVDTIRPVKKVDAAGSLRLSADFVGSMRSRESGNTSSPTSPTTASKDKSVHRRAASEAGKAGRVIVDDVVLPSLKKVRIF
jgi:serine/threonine-protein kinase 24/25/MST4